MTQTFQKLTCPACGGSLTLIDTRTGLSPTPLALSDLAVTCNACDYAAATEEHLAIENALTTIKCEIKAGCANRSLLDGDDNLPESLPETFAIAHDLKGPQIAIVAGAIARWIEDGELQDELTEAGVLCRHCNRMAEDEGLCMAHLDARDEAAYENRFGC